MPNGTTAGDRRKDPERRKQVREVAKHLSPRMKKQLNALHENRRALDERAFYPEHNARTNSPQYTAIHDKLVHQDKRACLVCGVTADDVSPTRTVTARNPYGAKQMETHHHVIEWALANAIDPAKFNTHVRPGLARRNPAEPMYQRPMSQQEILDWVDHHPDNLWVLCDIHHRAPYLGIHEISGPIWGPQDLFEDSFLAAVRRELAKGAPAKASSKKKAPAKRRAHRPQPTR